MVILLLFYEDVNEAILKNLLKNDKTAGRNATCCLFKFNIIL